MPYAPTPAIRVSREPNARDFANDVAQLAGELLLAVPDLNDAERHMLKDVRDGRHKFVVFSRIIGIAARSSKPEHLEAPAEIVRGVGLAAFPRPMSVAAAFDEETRATTAAEMPQREFERTPCRSTWRRAVDALTTQYHATRGALDVLLAHRPL